MRPLGGNQALGNFYEMRSYTFLPGAIPQLSECWAKTIPQREEYSPLAAGIFIEVGGLNKWIHIWPYKSMEDRTCIRTEMRQAGVWLLQGSYREPMVRQENEMLIPVAFSPMHQRPESAHT
jgi:hypothetical protein